MNPSLDESRELVKSRIKGFRVGSTAPAYEHSFRVYETLKTYEYNYDICLVGLLSEVIVPGGVAVEELTRLGYSRQIIQMVDLVTLHEPDLPYSDRQLKHLNRLLDAGVETAWMIKTAKSLDDLNDVDGLPYDAWFAFTKKFAPSLAYYLRPYYGKPLVEAFRAKMRDHLYARRNG